MKKITFFIGSLEEGGAERVVSHLTSYLADKGHEVLLVLYHDRELFYPPDPRVEIVSAGKETENGGLLKRLLRLLLISLREPSAVIM